LCVDPRWLEEQSKQIKDALFGNQPADPAEPERYSRSLQMPFTTRRWFCDSTLTSDEPQEHASIVTSRNARLKEIAKTYPRNKDVTVIFHNRPLSSGISTAAAPVPADELAWKKEHAPWSRWDPDRKSVVPEGRRTGAEDKKRESWTRTADDGLVIEDTTDRKLGDWAAKLLHPQARSKGRKLTDDVLPAFHRARADRIRREFRLMLAVAHEFRIPRRIARAAAKERLREKPKLHELSRRVSWLELAPEVQKGVLAEREFNRALDEAQGPGNHWLINEVPLARADSILDHTGWAARVGTRKADRLLALKRARQNVEAAVERYLDRDTSPVVAALWRLRWAIRRLLIRPAVPVIQAELPQRVAVELARQEAEDYTTLAEIDEEGASAVPEAVVEALTRTIRRLLGKSTPVPDAVPLMAVLRGQPGDGQRVIDAAAAYVCSIQPATLKKSRRAQARRTALTPDELARARAAQRAAMDAAMESYLRPDAAD
jgi:hypothetical protein